MLQDIYVYRGILETILKLSVILFYFPLATTQFLHEFQGLKAQLSGGLDNKGHEDAALEEALVSSSLLLLTLGSNGQFNALNNLTVGRGERASDRNVPD